MSLQIENLGIGISLRPDHYEEIAANPPSIDWFEIISDNFLSMEGQNNDFLEFILELYPIVQHGVALCIGSADPLDFDYLRRLKNISSKNQNSMDL